jgi:hypothetical protein
MVNHEPKAWEVLVALIVERLRGFGSRVVGLALRLIGIRRSSDEGDDGSPR